MQVLQALHLLAGNVHDTKTMTGAISVAFSQHLKTLVNLMKGTYIYIYMYIHIHTYVDRGRA